MDNSKRKQIFVFLAILLIAVIGGILGYRLDGDVMWHFKTGEFIVTNRIIPHTDVFSWQQGLNWMCHEWLYDIVLFLFYSNFGETAVKGLLIIALLVPLFISYQYNKKYIKYPVLYLVYLIFIMAFWNNSYCARPGEFSIGILLIESILLLSDYKHRNILSFLLAILMVNIHGGSIAELLVLPLLLLISDIVSDLALDKDVFKNIQTHVISFMCIFAGSLINPYGIRIYKYTIDNFMKSGYINSHIQEWMPTTFVVLMAVFVVGMLLCMGADEKFKKFDKKALRTVILICAFTCEGMTIKRMYFPASCVLMVFGYQYLEKYLDRLLNLTWNKYFKKPLIPKKLYKLITEIGIVFTGCLTLTCTVLYLGAADMHKSFIETVDEKYPEMKEISDYMKENKIDGKIYNMYGDGGTLILHDIKTFVDPRCDPFMEGFSDTTSLYDYCVASDAKKTTKYEAFKEMSEKYDFEYALTNKSYPTDREVIKGLKDDDCEVLVENDKYALIKIK